MAEVIPLNKHGFCVECPKCGSQLFYSILLDDLQTVDRLECGGFDLFGDECDYSIEFEDDFIEFQFEQPARDN